MASVAAIAAAGGCGLLQGVDVPNSDMYSVQLKYWDPLEEMGYLKEAATRDAMSRNCTVGGYIDGLRSSYAKFLASDHIADRKELKFCFDSAIISPQSTGKVSIVWGPKSTGKTKLLETMCSQFSASEEVLVVYVNARQQTVAQGIAEAIDNMDKKGDGSTWEKIAESFSGVVNAATALKLAQVGAATAANAVVSGAVAVGSLLSALNTLELCGKLEPVDADLELLKGFLSFSKSLGKHPSLVIDEANLVVTGEASNQRLLSAICSHTKEHRVMNVTLCTSSHTYPHKLAALEGLPLQHTKIHYAAELPPKEMWHFLTKEKAEGETSSFIGMGEHLARACIAACGGNIFLVGDLLEKALDRKSKILRCLTFIEGATAIQGLLDDAEVAPILTEMAGQGYTLIRSIESDSVKKIANARVAGIVLSDHVSSSQLQNILEQDVFGIALVPSSEALRNVILFEIKQKTV